MGIPIAPNPKQTYVRTYVMGIPIPPKRTYVIGIPIPPNPKQWWSERTGASQGVVAYYQGCPTHTHLSGMPSAHRDRIGHISQELQGGGWHYGAY